jgi:hypothetical protein
MNLIIMLLLIIFLIFLVAFVKFLSLIIVFVLSLIWAWGNKVSILSNIGFSFLSPL